MSKIIDTIGFCGFLKKKASSSGHKYLLTLSILAPL